MENASKALIIAGAILISIILISIGIMIVNGGMGIVDRGIGSMTSQEIQVFNSQFTNYEGTQRGSVVKTLMETVSSSNATNDDKVTVSGEFGSTPDEVRAAVKATTRYEVKLTKDEKSGLITSIEVSKASSSSET